MKKRYIFIVITIILAIVIQVLSVNITPALKKIADKEINRFCQMVINNTPFPVTLDHQELIKINRNGDEIATINFNTPGHGTAPPGCCEAPRHIRSQARMP